MDEESYERIEADASVGSVRDVRFVSHGAVEFRAQGLGFNREDDELQLQLLALPPAPFLLYDMVGKSHAENPTVQFPQPRPS